MSYNIKNALADFKKEDLADGMIDILKDSTRTLEKTKENGFLKHPSINEAAMLLQP